MLQDKRGHGDAFEEETQHEELSVSKRLRTSPDQPAIGPGSDDSTRNSSIPKDNLEFEVLQKYREMDKDFSKLKAMTMRGDGDISTVLNSLSTLNQLFNNVQIVNNHANTTDSTHTHNNNNNNNNNNNIFAYDSRAIVNISELTQLNVKNLQLGEIKSMLNLNDLILFIKRYLLKEYLNQNNIIISDTSLSDIEDDPKIGQSNRGSNEDTENVEEGKGEEEEEDQYTDPISRNLQKHVRRQQYLEQFDKFNKFNQFNWFKMGSIFKNYNQSITVTDHLLGPFSLERKKRSLNNNRRSLNNEQDQLLNPASRQTAENVTKDDLINNQDLTTPEQVIKCYKLLLSKVGYNSKISLFKFILNPNSFAKSVENLFYTSFLIKDGRLILEPGDNDSDQGFPVLRIKPDLKDLTEEEREIERQKRSDAQQNHIIFQLDMETWQKLIKKFDITESFIP
ncbi:Smc5-Smc6 complex subunit NSE4 PWA37_002242 [Arxiozyma heterogenica]|uniref:Smc5-Smc6 complex subunit NSE4 n=1 Tax=Arxiozyma heterogenica TaxID=278026 RepID=UPI002F0253C5